MAEFRDSFPPAPIASSNAQPSVPAQKSTSGNIKETVESILVAFILAFIFRAFVVEAFVIPTGSMASTLMGAHMQFTCSHCGYEFQVNYSSGAEGEDVRIPSFAEVVVRNPQTNRDEVRPRVYSIHCPNCGLKLPRSQTTRPPIHYGDRILVLKYLYLFEEPQRWDVVVFKSPSDPETYDYAQNYIKRLVGRPHESIMILDGDIYVGRKGISPEQFVVQTKPHVVQESLWRIVHDNDFYPRKSELTLNWRQPWQLKSGSGWELGAGPEDGRVFRFNNRDGAGQIAFDHTASPRKYAFTDWLAYDSVTDQEKAKIADTYDDSRDSRWSGSNTVTDLKLQFFHERHAGDGPLSISLSKATHLFTAELTPGKAVIRKTVGDASETLGEIAIARRSGPMKIEFANVDYRVSLRIDNEEVFATTPEQYRPSISSLLDDFRGSRGLPPPSVQISAGQQESALSHISLWRDIYYRNESDRALWGSPARFPDQLMDLGADEYFVLGDNSPVSLDSRYWTDPINLQHEKLVVRAGVVPGRFLLGKAFFVYWPAGYKVAPGGPSLVPNFGDMRFIH